MRKISLILLSGILCMAASAQELVSEALPFMQIDFNPVSTSMGSSIVPSAAVLPLGSTRLAAGVAYENYMPDLGSTQYISGGVAGKAGRIGASLNFTRGTGEEISAERFTPSEVLVNAGVSYAFNPMIAAGINVKYAKEQLLSDYSNHAVAADMFLSGKLENMELTAGVSSIGSRVQSKNTGNFNLPSAVTAGGAYLIAAEDYTVLARARADYYFSGHLAAGAGAEFCYNNMFSFRAGYHYGGESIIPSFASIGAGLHIGEFTLDAAYIFASEALAGSFSICAGVRF